MTGTEATMIVRDQTLIDLVKTTDQKETIEKEVVEVDAIIHHIILLHVLQVAMAEEAAVV